MNMGDPSPAGASTERDMHAYVHVTVRPSHASAGPPTGEYRALVWRLATATTSVPVGPHTSTHAICRPIHPCPSFISSCLVSSRHRHSQPYRSAVRCLPSQVPTATAPAPSETMETEMAAAAAAALCCALALYLYHALWLAPGRVRAALRAQGVAGPRPSFPYGNRADMRRATAAHRGGGGGVVHDYRQALFPHYERWRKEYGTTIDRRRACVRVACFYLSSSSLPRSSSMTVFDLFVSSECARSIGIGYYGFFLFSGKQIYIGCTAIAS